MTRELTNAEVRENFLREVRDISQYWTGRVIDREPPLDNATRKIVLERVNGALYSLLSSLDGNSGAVPGFRVIPRTSPSDRQYDIDQEEDYYPIINPDDRIETSGVLLIDLVDGMDISGSLCSGMINAV